jgi:hypothetical protein
MSPAVSKIFEHTAGKSQQQHDLHPQLPAYFFIFFYLQQLSPTSELATNWWTQGRVC